MTRYAFSVNADLCIGCSSCGMACKNQNDLAPGMVWRKLDLPGMDQLCRPESVIQQTKDGKNYLVVISEDSGPECDGVPFTYIRAEILPGHSCGH